MSDLRVSVGAFLLVFAAVTTGFVGGVTAQETVTLTITVVDQNDDPRGGMNLTVSWDGTSVNRTTFSNGKALVDVPKGANVTIRVHDGKYVRNYPKTVTNVTGGDVTVEVARQGRATIRVRSPQGNVGNAIVQLYRNGRTVVNTRADGNGRLTTKAIERGTYQLNVYKAGYFSNETTLQVDGHVNRTMVIEQGSVLVTFNVTDDHFSPPRPVVNATVSLKRRASVTTLSNGQVTVSAPVNTRLSVTVTKDGYETATLSPYVREQRKTVEVQISRTPGLNVRPDNDRVVVNETVGVSVVDEYGDPVSNATVMVGGETVNETDARGRVRVTIESAGNVTITATKGSLTATATVEGVAVDGTEPTPTDEPTTREPGDSEPTTTTTTGGSGPGFTPLAVLVALALFAVGTRRQ